MYGNYAFRNKQTKLGEGSFGIVYREKVAGLNKLVAVKYLKQKDTESLKRFAKEIETLQKLRHHDNIVQILDHSFYSENPYFIMEYCDCGSMRQFVGNTTDENAIAVLESSVMALKEIHKTKGFHRDFKPDNILLKSNGKGSKLTVKLSDFGLARAFTADSNMTQTPAGTFAYMAPEIQRGENYTQAADIYSLGITLIELITGNTHRGWLTSIPFDLREILLKMTDSEPANRPNVWGLEVLTARLKEARSNSFSKFFASLNMNQLGLGAGLFGLAVLIGGSGKE